MGHPTAPLPFGTGSNEVLMSDTPTEHQTCSTGTLLFWSIHKLSTTTAWLSTPLYSPHPLAAPASPLVQFLSCPSMAFFRAFKAAHSFPPLEGRVLWPGNTDHHWTPCLPHPSFLQQESIWSLQPEPATGKTCIGSGSSGQVLLVKLAAKFLSCV